MAKLEVELNDVSRPHQLLLIDLKKYKNNAKFYIVQKYVMEIN